MTTDPILLQRARAQRLATLGQRIGYGLYAIAVVAFFVGLLTNFSGAISALVIGSIIIGSFFLAPAIVAGYAVKAAIRDDIEHGRPLGGDSDGDHA